MPTVVCLTCRAPRTVSRAMASMIRTGRCTGNCRSCSNAALASRLRAEADAACASRFWSKVRRGSSCWTWSGRIGDRGYGQFDDGDRTLRAHRVAWTLTRGEIPAGMQVLHRCDNPACVRPDHLFLGTHDDNMRDMAAKGRQRGGRPRQERCGRGHHLTEPGARTASGDCRRCGRERAAAHRLRLLNLRAVERGAA